MAELVFDYLLVINDKRIEKMNKPFVEFFNRFFVWFILTELNFLSYPFGWLGKPRQGGCTSKIAQPIRGMSLKNYAWLRRRREGCSMKKLMTLYGLVTYGCWIITNIMENKSEFCVDFIVLVCVFIFLMFFSSVQK